MTTEVGILLAGLAGVLAFVSPCILPVIPSYLSFIAGGSEGSGGDSGRARTATRATVDRRAALRTVAFVLGFTVTFVVLGVLLSGTMLLFGSLTAIINAVAGGIVILLGLNVIFDFWKQLNIERRLHLRRAPGGFGGAFLLGVAFGGGWTPCVGPILSSILLLAGTSGRVVEGGVLLTAFSLGLGLPFIAAGLFSERLLRELGRLRPYLRGIRIASGVFLILVGVLILFGRLARLNAAFANAARSIETWGAAHPIGAQLAFAAAALLPVLLLLIGGMRTDARQQRRREPPTVRSASPVRLAFAGAFAVLAVLFGTGIVDGIRVLTVWFTYQGL